MGVRNVLVFKPQKGKIECLSNRISLNNLWSKEAEIKEARKVSYLSMLY